MKPSIEHVDLKKYKIIKSIGKGSYGEVYLVREKSTGKYFAAKAFSRPNTQDNKWKDFDNEIYAFTKVQNHAILKIYGYCEKNFLDIENPVLITEYMTNSSLDKALKNTDKVLTQANKYLILLGTAIGMKSLHSKGIIHRDLKPGNILLDDKYHPYICDFGISSHDSELELSNIIMNTPVGTPLYQAPEILREEEQYDYRIDIFSFSLIAYELITNEKPFKGYKSIYKLQSDIIRGKRPNTSNIKDDSISDFLKYCWSESPDVRPSFNIIVEEYLQEKYRKLFGVTDADVDSYLSYFDKDLYTQFSESRITREINNKIEYSEDPDEIFKYAQMYDLGIDGVVADQKKLANYTKEPAN